MNVYFREMYYFLLVEHSFMLLIPQMCCDFYHFI